MGTQVSDLKPCPFCGGEAHASSSNTYGCKECTFYLQTHVWNRRAHDATETDALRALRSEIASVPPSNCAGYVGRWMSALDAILKERE